MANDFFSRIASKIDALLQLFAAPPITLEDVAARSSLEVPENKSEEFKAILNNIKALLYDSGRQIRDDAIEQSLKELQDLVIVVEDFVDNCQYKMFPSDAKFIRRRMISWDYMMSYDSVDDSDSIEFPSEDFIFWHNESRIAEGNTFEIPDNIESKGQSSSWTEESCLAACSSIVLVNAADHPRFTASPHYGTGDDRGANAAEIIDHPVSPLCEIDAAEILYHLQVTASAHRRTDDDRGANVAEIINHPRFTASSYCGIGNDRRANAAEVIDHPQFTGSSRCETDDDRGVNTAEVIDNSQFTASSHRGTDEDRGHRSSVLSCLSSQWDRQEGTSGEGFPYAPEIPDNIACRIVGIKRTFDYLAHHQKDQKCASHLLLISQEKQNSEKLQRVTEFLLAESSSLKSIKDLNYFPEDAIRGRKHYHAFDVTKQIYGRNSDREYIIYWLLLSTNSRFSFFEDERCRNKFSAISIVGMAGVGKTTLAKEVYNDPLICKHFNSRGWLHLTEECDAVSLSKSFFVSITGKSCDGKEPVHLQSVMKEELKGKRLLLVLDDPQDLNPRLWEYLQAPLAGVRMAKFIITSRTELDASKLRGIESYSLSCLCLDLSWDLFQHYAFREDSSRPPELIEIGKHIVKKCSGLPIAVKTLGSLLGYQMDRQIWTDVLESELWKLQETETDIYPALQLSYYLLPTYLKPCFLYCSLFPRGYKFDKYELVRLWMAQGYIHHEDGQSLETVGCNYFHELQMLSIFDRSWDGTFTIHNLLYDVSKYMSNGECSSSSDVKMHKDSGKIRQLYVTSSKRTNELHSSNENLTLQLLYKTLGGVLPDDFLTRELIGSIQGIRVLELTHHGDSSTAETTQEKTLDKPNTSLVSYPRFIHLRYLRICDRFIEVLPATVCHLYNLQTLTLDKCLKLRELPSNIGELVNLRYLGLSEANIEMLPGSVCQLLNLQSLIVDCCRNMKELPCNIGNLVNLCHLGFSGTSIKRLPESVNRLSKLPTLNLDHCKRPTELPSSLGNLVNLQHITACKTKITKLPESISLLSNLLTLDLAYSNLSELPNGIGFLVNLSYLALSYTNTSILPESLCQLSSLLTLKLNGCTNLSQLPSDIGALKRLSHLVVSGIDIEQLPASVCHLFNLEVLEMDGCRRFFSLPDGIGYLTKLRQLKLSDTEIQELPESICQLSNLQNLELNGCQRLSKLPESIGDLSELSNLEVTETKIKALPASFCQLSNLKVLNLNGNLDLQELPSGIENLANLCQLELSEVGIEVLPRCIGRLTNLEKLSFEHKQKPFEIYQL